MSGSLSLLLECVLPPPDPSLPTWRVCGWDTPNRGPAVCGASSAGSRQVVCLLANCSSRSPPEFPSRAFPRSRLSLSSPLLSSPLLPLFPASFLAVQCHHTADTGIAPPVVCRVVRRDQARLQGLCPPRHRVQPFQPVHRPQPRHNRQPATSRPTSSSIGSSDPERQVQARRRRKGFPRRVCRPGCGTVARVGGAHPGRVRGGLGGGRAGPAAVVRQVRDGAAGAGHGGLGV